MGLAYQSQSIAQVFDRLAAAARRRDIPARVVSEARAATLRALDLDPAKPCPAKCRRRIESYYWAVVKRRVLRGGVAPLAAARLVAASVVADLESAGRNGVDIWHELEQGWAGRLPSDVLEEYRARLCA